MADEQDDEIVEFTNADYKKEVTFGIVKLSKLVTDAVAEGDDDDDDEDDGSGGPKKHTIPLESNVTSEVLDKVIEFCTYYKTTPMTPIASPFPEQDEIELNDLVQDWYADFALAMESKVLFQLLISANYMNIQPLLDLSCLAVAKFIHRKSEDEIREIFNIKKPEPPEAKEEGEAKN